MCGLCATIGFFDGVHRGHQYLFTQLISLSQVYGLHPVIYTFQQHPLEVLCGHSPTLLTTSEERQSLLQHYGDVVFLNFCDVQHMTAENFMRYLYTRNVRMLLMGYDHRFGSDKLTDIADYQHAGSHVGVRVLRAEECLDSGKPISSSRIRRLLQKGAMEEANHLLGYSYSITGKVVHGNGIGRQLGFPTANVQYPQNKLIPPIGVYSGMATIDKENTDRGKREMPCSINIGTNPTIGNKELSIEAHILGFEGSLYEKQLTIQFSHFIRSEKHFPSIDSLREQIRKDINTITNLHI